MHEIRHYHSDKGIYVGQTYYVLALHPDDINKLSQKGNTIGWLTHQAGDITFDPNTKSQCVYSRMFRAIFGNGHDFCVDFGSVTYEKDGENREARLSSFAERYQQALLDYLIERDGADENDDVKAGSRVTRDEAITVAKGVRGR